MRRSRRWRSSKSSSSRAAATRWADLFEGEGGGRVGADVALRAVSLVAAGAEGIVVAAVVVAVKAAVAAAHLVADGADAAGAALDEAAQKQSSGLGAAGVP